MEWFAMFQLAMQIAPVVQNIISTGVSLKSVTDAVKNPELLSAFEQVGAKLFPKAAPALHAIAAIVTAYSPDYTKWLQNSLNKLVTPSPGLVVDGQYGPKTRAAVEALQTQLGLKIDGWAGDITMAAIQTALTKHA